MHDHSSAILFDRLVIWQDRNCVFPLDGNSHLFQSIVVKEEGFSFRLDWA
jgi:hypothetical protein